MDRPERCSKTINRSTVRLSQCHTRGCTAGLFPACAAHSRVLEHFPITRLRASPLDEHSLRRDWILASARMTLGMSGT